MRIVAMLAITGWTLLWLITGLGQLATRPWSSGDTFSLFVGLAVPVVLAVVVDGLEMKQTGEPK